MPRQARSERVGEHPQAMQSTCLPHRLLEMQLQPSLSSPGAASVAERSFMAAGCTVEPAQLEGDELLRRCTGQTDCGSFSSNSPASAARGQRR